MNLIEDLATAGRSRQDQCGICTILRRLPKDEREALETALAGTIGRETLQHILQGNGHPEGTRHWIARHRREGH